MSPPNADGPADRRGRRDALRTRIAVDAARGVAAGDDAKRAVFRAARRLTRGWVPPEQLPSVDEVRARAEARLDPSATLAAGDRLGRIAALCGLLATVRGDREGRAADDALEHALGVFALVRAERPYDEELLTAALVQEVGLTIDRDAAVAAGLAALGDAITPRTRWFVESVAAAHAHRAGTLGHRARLRLEAHPDFEDVLLLAAADRRARGGGPTLDEAITMLRDLDRDSGGA